MFGGSHLSGPLADFSLFTDFWTAKRFLGSFAKRTRLSLLRVSTVATLGRAAPYDQYQRQRTAERFCQCMD